MGERTRALAFFGVEAGSWTAFAAYRVQGSGRRESYIEMLQLFAQVDEPGGRSEEYYRRLGVWPSSDLYNDLVRRDARALYGDDLAAREEYFRSHQVPEDEAWRWESGAAQERYREKRNDSQRSYRRSRNMLGLLAVNRFVAMIDAVLLQQSHGNTRLALEPGDDGARLSARLALTRSLP